MNNSAGKKTNIFGPLKDTTINYPKPCKEGILNGLLNYSSENRDFTKGKAKTEEEKAAVISKVSDNVMKINVESWEIKYSGGSEMFYILSIFKILNIELANPYEVYERVCLWQKKNGLFTEDPYFVPLIETYYVCHILKLLNQKVPNRDILLNTIRAAEELILAKKYPEKQKLMSKRQGKELSIITCLYYISEIYKALGEEFKNSQRVFDLMMELRHEDGLFYSPAINPGKDPYYCVLMMDDTYFAAEICDFIGKYPLHKKQIVRYFWDELYYKKGCFFPIGWFEKNKKNIDLKKIDASPNLEYLYKFISLILKFGGKIKEDKEIIYALYSRLWDKPTGGFVHKPGAYPNPNTNFQGLNLYYLLTKSHDLQEDEWKVVKGSWVKTEQGEWKNLMPSRIKLFYKTVPSELQQYVVVLDDNGRIFMPL